MKRSLREVCVQAIEAYPTTPRSRWVLHWPGQVVLASSSVHWTAEVTQVSRGHAGRQRSRRSVVVTWKNSSIIKKIWRIILLKVCYAVNKLCVFLYRWLTTSQLDIFTANYKEISFKIFLVFKCIKVGSSRVHLTLLLDGKIPNYV